MNRMDMDLPLDRLTVTITLTETERHHLLGAMLDGTVTTACGTCAGFIEKLRRVATEGTDDA